ncbi:MAG: 3-dehydroquinate synthase [Bacteroidetes bacterium]|nr:3-dehydroquinate synthase [Bacteroidota bacterium]
MIEKVVVDLKENSYPILIGDKILSGINELINKYKLNRHLLVIMDENVKKNHFNKIRNEINSIDIKANYYTLKAGENSKSYIELNKIYSYLLQNNYGRDSMIVAVGGGVTGDLAGYVSATFMRGIQLVHIPTTLLAAVDSSIGGKTGINFEKKKNMIGAFYQPKFVLIDINFIKTLPIKEITSGIGEIIKYSFLSDRNFFSFINNNLNEIYNLNDKILKEVIFTSAAIKASVVSQDEKETGLRKILNFGHTFAHAFETNLNFKIKHGEAVIAGIVCSLILSNKIGLLSKAKLDEFLTLPLKVKLPQQLKKMNKEELYKIMLHDKKNRNEKIKFVLISNLGEIIIDVEADKVDVISSINQMEEIIS